MWIVLVQAEPSREWALAGLLDVRDAWPSADYVPPAPQPPDPQPWYWPPWLAPEQPAWEPPPVEARPIIERVEIDTPAPWGPGRCWGFATSGAADAAMDFMRARGFVVRAVEV